MLVEPRDVDALAGALAAVIDDDARRDELIRRGRAHVATFSWDACAASMIDLYREAVAERSTRTA